MGASPLASPRLASLSFAALALLYECYTGAVLVLYWPCTGAALVYDTGPTAGTIPYCTGAVLAPKSNNVELVSYGRNVNSILAHYQCIASTTPTRHEDPSNPTPARPFRSDTSDAPCSRLPTRPPDPLGPPPGASQCKHGSAMAWRNPSRELCGMAMGDTPGRPTDRVAG